MRPPEIRGQYQLLSVPQVTPAGRKLERGRNDDSENPCCTGSHVGCYVLDPDLSAGAFRDDEGEAAGSVRRRPADEFFGVADHGGVRSEGRTGYRLTRR